MRTEMIAIIGLACAVVSVGKAEAGRGLIGVGSRTCGTFIEARKGQSAQELQFRSWIFGFISGANVSIPPEIEGEAIKDGDGDGLIVWIDNYCAKNPLDTVGQAANALGVELFQRGLANGQLKYHSK